MKGLMHGNKVVGFAVLGDAYVGEPSNELNSYCPTSRSPGQGTGRRALQRPRAARGRRPGPGKLGLDQLAELLKAQALPTHLPGFAKTKQE